MNKANYVDPMNYYYYVNPRLFDFCWKLKFLSMNFEDCSSKSLLKNCLMNFLQKIFVVRRQRFHLIEDDVDVVCLQEFFSKNCAFKLKILI